MGIGAKSANAFLLLLFRRTEILLKFAQNRLEIPLCDKDATLPRRSLHIGSHGETRGVSDGGAITTFGVFHTFRKPCVAGV